MNKPTLFSFIQTSDHPNFSKLYEAMGYKEVQFMSLRKLISALKKQKPDVIVAQFLYAFSNNYASNHISNLDTLLITLQQYPSYNPTFIFLAYKDEAKYLERLLNHYKGVSKVNHALLLPVSEQKMKEIL